MSTIFEIKNEYMQLLDMIDDPEIDAQTLADTMEAIEGELEEKADNYARVIADASALSDGLKAQIDRLTERKRAIENNTKRMKEALQDAMQSTGKTNFKTQLFSFRIQKNPPSVNITEGAKLPEKYLIPQPEKIDKKSIIADLKAGSMIDGCTLVQSESLRIK